MKKILIIILLLLILLPSVILANWSKELSVGDCIKVILNHSKINANYFLIYYRGYVADSFVFAVPQGYTENYYYVHKGLDTFKVKYQDSIVKIKVKESFSNLKVCLDYEILKK
jgi:hypothetical protein